MGTGGRNADGGGPETGENEDNAGLNERLKLDRERIGSITRNASGLAEARPEEAKRQILTDRAVQGADLVQQPSLGPSSMESPEQLVNLKEDYLAGSQNEESTSTEGSVDDCISISSDHVRELTEQAYNFRLQRLSPKPGASAVE